MTESQLLDHICDTSGLSAKGYQPPYFEAGIPLHPDKPVDYEQVRAQFVESVLGRSDFIYHPAFGCPHIDICRYPKNLERPFSVYLTNGMSDFPLMFPDGTSQRIELAVCTEHADKRDINSPDSITQILRYVSIFPFITKTFLNYFHTVELPEAQNSTRPKYVALIPPFLLPRLATIDLMGQEIKVISLIPLKDQEYHTFSQGLRLVDFIENLPDSLDTWLFDKSLTVRAESSKGKWISRLRRFRC